MNLPNIETFLAIAETGQLNRAAIRLHVTQSTVTARLNSLETELGQTLFLRRKSGAELTSAGFRFQRYAQLMIDTWRQARRETALPADIDATFNLGCHPDLWEGLGVRFFEYLHDNHPRIAISTWSGEQPELDRWLGSGLVDAALGYAPTANANRREYRLPADQLVLVSTQPRELMRQDPDYIYVDSGEEFRRNHALAYADGDTPTVTLASPGWARDYLLARGGSGYLPLRMIGRQLEEGSLHRVAAAPVFERSVYLIINKDAASNWSFLPDLLTIAGFDEPEVR